MNLVLELEDFWLLDEVFLAELLELSQTEDEDLAPSLDELLFADADDFAVLKESLDALLDELLAGSENSSFSVLSLFCSAMKFSSESCLGALTVWEQAASARSVGRTAQ